MTRQEKCEAILQHILRAVADEDSDGITFAPDYGYGSATIVIGKAHTHVGIEDPSYSEEERFGLFVDSLHAQLLRGRGLSWENGGVADSTRRYWPTLPKPS